MIDLSKLGRPAPPARPASEARRRGCRRASAPSTARGRLVRRALALLLLLLGCGPLAAADGPTPDPETGPPIEGLVTAAGSPLAGARVRLVPVATIAAGPEIDPHGRLAGAEAQVATARSRADGSFSVAPPGPGPWGVRVDAAGYVGLERVVEVLDRAVDLPPAALRRAHDVVVRVVAPGAGPRRGRVAWPAGRPVDALPVDRWRPIPVAAPVNEEGTASLAVPVREGGEIQVVVPGFPPGRAAASGPATAAELKPAAPFDLRVVDAGGNPMAGVRVFAAFGPLPVAETDGDGRASTADPAALAELPGSRERGLVLVARDGSVDRVPLSDLGGAQPGTLRFDAPGRVSGRVVQEGTGRPLAGALVWSRPPRPGALARTARDGTFELSGVRDVRDVRDGGDTGDTGDTRATLIATAAAHRPGRASAAAAREVEIALPPTRRAVGWVVDQEDRPVAHAEIRLKLAPEGAPEGAPADGPWPRAAALGPYRTGADGAFEVPNPPVGRIDLAVKAAGFSPVTVPGIEVPPRSSTVDLGTVALVAGAELVGRVVDGEGRPVAEARVLMAPVRSLGWEADLSMGGVPREAVTDAAGEFLFSDLTPGSAIRLQARKEGFVASEPREQVLPSDGPVEVVLERPATLSGWVVDGSGRPVPQALVTAERLPPEAEEAGAASAWTSPDGDFEISGVQPGRLAVRASAPGYRDGRSGAIEVEAGDELPTVEIVLEEGASLAGRVVEADGAAAAGATVDLTDAEGAEVAFARADAAGRFDLTGLPSGAHTLTAVAGDGREASRQVDLGDVPLDVTLVLEGGYAVRGRVTRDDGAPVQGASVLLAGSSTAGGTVEVKSGPLGQFELAAVRDGVYQLQASAEDLAPSRVIRVAVDGGPVDDLELVLDDGISLRGRVLGVAFGDLPAVRVRVRGAPGAVARVDHAGAFVLRHLPAGEVAVEVGLDGTGRVLVERIELPAGAQEVEASLWLPEGSAASR